MSHMNRTRFSTDQPDGASPYDGASLAQAQSQFTMLKLYREI
jgi:hypothetical protein